ncbi:MAG: DNA polymerase II large subunit [Nanoarchaeota archaeon]
MSMASPSMEQHFNRIDAEVARCYTLASEARKKGYDPEDRVDIPLAKNMAERVEGLISAVAPQLVGTKMTSRIQDLEERYGKLDWRVGLVIGEEVAKEAFCTFKTKLEAMEIGIRVGFAYLTGGIVAAPLEGFIELKLKKRNDDGKEYFSVCYAGPVRGAGGTAAATSVLLADYIRKRMGYAPYDPTQAEINRYLREVEDYHERVANLQYKPTEEELVFMISHVPVEISGDPTEELEVSNYKDLPRVETNRLRSGICLVLCEGLSQKAAKVWKRVGVWGADFGLDWGFLKEFLDIQKAAKAGGQGKEATKLMPNFTFIKDLVAGRPILTYPMAVGGFRLRYGRTRTSGFSAAAIHPSTMWMLEKYIATGTQLKVERPGKACVITPCDSIDGPIVKLKDGSVVQVKDEEEARRVANEVKEILFLGDILFNYGDFSENNHRLVPAGYCPEWWAQELEQETINLFGTLDFERLAEFVEMDSTKLERMIKSPLQARCSAAAALNLSRKLPLPLHPDFTYHWQSLGKAELLSLTRYLSQGTGSPHLVLPVKEEKRLLELIGVPHQVAQKEYVVIDEHHALVLKELLGAGDREEANRRAVILEGKQGSAIELLYQSSGIRLRDKSGTFIGARMGRPEKAKMRELTGSPHVLFPVGDQGGRLRSFQAALMEKRVEAEAPTMRCACGNTSLYRVCERCGKRTERIVEKVEFGFNRQSLDIEHYFSSAIAMLKLETYPDLIKGVRGTSNKDHTPEHLAKGVLRAFNDVYVNKDGTTRYDMTELPITHFMPREIGQSVARIKELGYRQDIHGKDIESEDQIVELFPQDLILPAGKDLVDDSAEKVLFRIAAFVDDLLERFYGLEPYYRLKAPNDLVGHLVIGLAPHISAGMVGRIIGFSQTQGCYAHPLFHAAMRRDCDGDEACVMLLMDGLLNFSRQYLPDKRGGRTMDAPLVLTSRLNPAEVDDMVLGIDIGWSYSLKLYESAQQFLSPGLVLVEQLRSQLGTERQYEKMGYTHPVSNINIGITCSAYKTLPSMEAKLKGQMDIAEKIRAVDAADVARLVIERHLIRDTKGNLRKFSMQQFRCVKCNQKFRRPPLIGSCTKCGGKLLFTISEGSVTKYMGPSISLAEKYDLPPYLKQVLELTKRRIEAVFGKEADKQEGLGRWFG